MLSIRSRLPAQGRPCRKVCLALAGLLACLVSGVSIDTAAARPGDPPNVVLIMTDDQGYGDMSCHGNEHLQTPSIDRLYRESIRLTDFHVDPTCSPTRSALMTGRYSCRTGVWHTIMGRSILRKDEETLANVFSKAGYKTGIFGKWHLGDCYPYRVIDRDWHVSLVHGGGGITQTPDAWGNTYFSPRLWKDGELVESNGYCTNVFFDAAMKFIDDNRDRPFFCYLPTNVPHGPNQVDEKYSAPFAKAGLGKLASFYGMLANFDENLGRMLARLDELGLAENTIVIFMTDNGTAAGGFNAGMRGRKGSEYEGGHRVPCFIRWPAQFKGARDIDTLAAHIDLLPTLVELCGIKHRPFNQLDGISLTPLLRAEQRDWPQRTLVVQSHRIEIPQPYRKSAVMTEQYRLVNGQELYDIANDPGQQTDIAGQRPEIVKQLREFYDAYWKDVSGRFDEHCWIELGSPLANPTSFTCHDWHNDDIRQVPWSQGAVRNNPPANGHWAVEIMEAGEYRFTLRARPKEANYPLEAGEARVKVGDVEATTPIPAGKTAATVTLELKTGRAMLQTWLKEEKRGTRGAFFVEVRRVK